MSLRLGAGLTALRSPGVLLGLVGSALLAVTACHTALRFRWTDASWPEPWMALGHAQTHRQSMWLAGAGVLLMVAGWVLVRDEDGPSMPWVAAWWCLPLLLAPPVLSSDAVLYADLAWTVDHGRPPYSVGFAETGSPVADLVRPFWRGTTPPYPPLSAIAAWAMAKVVGFSPFWSLLAMRVPALVGFGLVAFFVARLARDLGLDPRRAVWLGVANPLTVIHLVGGVHNDALMLGAAVAALWLAASRRWLLGAVVVGVAMLFKQQGVLVVWGVALVPVLDRLRAGGWPDRLRTAVPRVAATGGVAVGVFVAVSLATRWGFGWVVQLDANGRADTLAVSRLAGRAANIVLGLHGRPGRALVDAVATMGLVVSLVVIVVVLVAMLDRPLAGLAWASAAFALGGQACQPWYGVYPLVLLSLVPLGRRTRLVVAAAGTWLLVGAFLHELPRWPVLESAATALVPALAVAWSIRHDRVDTLRQADPGQEPACATQ